MKRNKSLFRLLTIIPLLVLLVATNIYQDPANIYHDNSREIAEAIASGNAVYSSSGNVDERQFKHDLITLMPDEIDCIAIGPSIVVNINKEMAGTDSFYNLGIGGGDYYDALAQLGMMEAYGKKTKRVIFCVDFYFFYERFFNAKGVHSESFRPYAQYMLSLIHHEKPVPVNEDDISKTNIIDMINGFGQAFSVTYFQSARDQIVRNNRYVMSGEGRWGIVDEDFDGSKPFYGSDASWTYAESVQARDEMDVKESCKKYYLPNHFIFNGHISKNSTAVFEALIAYLLEQGTDVELFLCPLPPSLWQRIEAQRKQYHSIDELSELAHSMSEKYNLKLTGGFNPYELGLTDADYYDARHLRNEALEKYFDFTGAVDKQ